MAGQGTRHAGTDTPRRGPSQRLRTCRHMALAGKLSGDNALAQVDEVMAKKVRTDLDPRGCYVSRKAAPAPTLLALAPRRCGTLPPDRPARAPPKPNPSTR